MKITLLKTLWEMFTTWLLRDTLWFYYSAPLLRVFGYFPFGFLFIEIVCCYVHCASFFLSLFEIFIELENCFQLLSNTNKNITTPLHVTLLRHLMMWKGFWKKKKLKTENWKEKEWNWSVIIQLWIYGSIFFYTLLNFLHI